VSLVPDVERFDFCVTVSTDEVEPFTMVIYLNSQFINCVAQYTY